MEWISVEDELPPDGAYLCSNLDVWIRVCYRFPSIDDREWRDISTNEIVTPSHWMPLPGPPQEK